jgi:hypothetical protein
VKVHLLLLVLIMLIAVHVSTSCYSKGTILLLDLSS